MGCYYKRKFYRKVYNLKEGNWSFGIAVYHSEKNKESYLSINFYKWIIDIGYMYECEIRR